MHGNTYIQKVYSLVKVRKMKITKLKINDY